VGLLGRQYTYHPDRPATNAERQRAFAQRRKAELIDLRKKTAQRAYHKSTRTDWETPWDVFLEFDAEFHFTLDVCASAENTKCARYFSEAEDGLTQDWGREICWMNPPYDRHIDTWLEKAYLSSRAGATVVAFIASRTGTKRWHTWVQGKASDIRFLQGRKTFVGAANPAGFDSVAVIYRAPSTP
jgi:phage N-6-adenine-methyltransferase